MVFLIDPPIRDLWTSIDLLKYLPPTCLMLTAGSYYSIHLSQWLNRLNKLGAMPTSSLEQTNVPFSHLGYISRLVVALDLRGRGFDEFSFPLLILIIQVIVGLVGSLQDQGYGVHFLYFMWILTLTHIHSPVWFCIEVIKKPSW